MVKKGVKLYKMKYVLVGSNETQWNVSILAMGWNDAEAYLKSQVGDLRVEERGGSMDIDTITPQCFLDRPALVPVEAVAEETVEAVAEETVEAVDIPTCPWCQKTYKTLGTLQTHIKKSHIE